MNWRAYWREINVYADGFLDNTPLTVGPLDPATNYTQATYWQNTNQFTLDVCVTNNNPAPMNGTICGGAGPVRRQHLSEQRVVVVQPTAAMCISSSRSPPGSPTKRICAYRNQYSDRSATRRVQGTHRISVQIDFRSGEQYLAAWIDGVQQGINGNNATYALPAGAAFMPYMLRRALPRAR